MACSKQSRRCILTYVHNKVDCVIGLQYGDEGKGKVAAAIAATGKYSLTARYNGGPNAGHTIHVNGKVLKLHQIPSSVPFKQQGYIAPGALVDFTKLENEAREFRNIMGFCPYKYLKISPKAIQILPRDIVIDSEYHHKSQGSTSSGIAPAYSRFYNRTAQLANTYTWPDENGIECIYDVRETDSLLLEGAQGFYLNPYQGEYPYTTSSSSHPGAAISNLGFSPRKIRNIIGVAKCYETRSGKDPFFQKVLNSKNKFVTPKPDSLIIDMYNRISELGQEIGVTTGRKRNIRFLDVNRLVHAVRKTGTNILVLQKWDILDRLGSSFKRYYMNGELRTSHTMRSEVADILYKNCPELERILFSQSPTNDIDWEKYL